LRYNEKKHDFEEIYSENSDYSLSEFSEQHDSDIKTPKSKNKISEPAFSKTLPP